MLDSIVGSKDGENNIYKLAKQKGKNKKFCKCAKDGDSMVLVHVMR